VSLAVAAALAGCAAATHRSGAAGREQGVPSMGWMPLGEWQHRLGEYLAANGDDPAALAQLPQLRTPATLRPGRIVFGAIDVDAVVAERDGYDVYGLLLDRIADPAGSWYLFIVGTVERRDYRPAEVTDVRLAAMSVRAGRTVWVTGSAPTEALARYRSRAAAAAVLRFPADDDRFRVSACADGVCVEEIGSGANWSIDLGGPPARARDIATPGRPPGAAN
jgi:hypothetical protein